MMIQIEDQKLTLEPGSTGKDLAEKLNRRDPHQSLALMLNGQLVDLDTPIQDGDQAELVDFDSSSGKEIFWHTSAHVLAQAVLRLYPEAVLTIGPPIENGFYYDFFGVTLSDQDFKAIEKEAQKIVKENYKPSKTTFKNKKEAIEAFKDNPYKVELLKGFDDQDIFTAYRQGDFFDLCRGPHLPNLGKIKAFKLLKVSGAYWRGNSDNEMLCRIYGISFPTKDQLKEYLHFLEEAKKRDHRVLGAKLDLFSFKEQAPGVPFIHPKGMIIWNTLINFWRAIHTEADYLEIQTPQLMNQDLWERSGHWQHYKENMFHFEIEEKAFAIKPMNCPGCMLYYKNHSHSYRELPLRVAELGHVHRYEPSGALSGLFRVRGFHQDDAHVFMKPADIKSEILNVLNLVEKLYSPFGLKYRFELSTRPEKSIGSDSDWEHTTQGLQAALDSYGAPYSINEGDGAFYGPKIDIHIEDCLKRSWQCGTVQLDMSLPERFDLVYMDSDGKEKRPIMIHRAIFGSVERFLAIVLEHFGGKLPLWLSPRQVRIIPVSEKHFDYAKTCQRILKEKKLLVEVDLSNESVSKKVRDAQLMQVNYMLTVGDQEVENQKVALRTRDNILHGQISIDDFVNKVTGELESKALTSPYSQSDKG